MKKVILTASLATLILTTAATAFAATNPSESAAPAQVPAKATLQASAQVQFNDANIIGSIYNQDASGLYTKTPLTLGEFKTTRFAQTLKAYSESVAFGNMTQQQFDEACARLKAEFANWNGLTSTISYVDMDGKTYKVPPFKQWNPGDPAVG
ncbi:hypothetical protein [Paenibacillus aestuarii]|uniref:S-layer homology domain-containing protein n=1 Tax=Paenibacillus aestuarii TaxID=516965 RepID=A0ABW0KB57_9BACL|nr:hypothetical protein [Paenibacillus aestuarii]